MMCLSFIWIEGLITVSLGGIDRVPRDCASLAAVKFVEKGHVFWRNFEVKYVSVGPHPLGIR